MTNDYAFQTVFSQIDEEWLIHSNRTCCVYTTYTFKIKSHLMHNKNITDLFFKFIFSGGACSSHHPIEELGEENVAHHQRAKLKDNNSYWVASPPGLHLRGHFQPPGRPCCRSTGENFAIFKLIYDPPHQKRKNK